MRLFRDYASLRMGGSSLWMPADLEKDPKLSLLIDPDQLFLWPGCEIVKDQRKTKVGRLLLEITGAPKRIYLKRYNAFSWRYRVWSLFSASAAYRSWTGAGILVRAGFLTGLPVAAVECRSWGMLTKSFYISEEIPQGKTVDCYWREELTPINGAQGFHLRREFLRTLARLFSSLHEMRIYHNDLKDANILVRGEDGEGRHSFYLLDLEGIRKYRHLSRRREIKNLVQLNRTMGRFLRRTEKLFWLKSYLGALFRDRRERRRWIRRVLEESERGDRRSLRKG